MKRLFLLLGALLICGTASANSALDTVHIFFKLDEEKLYRPAKTKLDSLLKYGIMNSNTAVLIIGYADYLGSEAHNMGLSARRAKAIQQYLINLRMPPGNIKLCIGKGEVRRSKTDADGYAPDRRVDVVISLMRERPTTSNKNSNIKVAELPPVKSAPPPPAPEKRKGIVAVSEKPPPLPPAAKKNVIKSKKPSPVLATIKVGQTIRLDNIYFVMGRHILTEESMPQLDKLFETLDDYPNLKIQIEGHICCLKYGFDAEDDDTHEKTLSLNRAKVIYEYLVSKGIEKDRLKYIGYGRSRPLVSPEETPQDEDRNRRVEIRVMEK